MEYKCGKKGIEQSRDIKERKKASCTMGSQMNWVPLLSALVSSIYGLHKRLDVARGGLRVLRKIRHLVVVDTNGKGSLENGEIHPGVAKVLGFRLERVLTTLVGYGSVRFGFESFLLPR